MYRVIYGSSGYGLVQLLENHVMDLETGEQMLECFHHQGMPYVLLSDISFCYLTKAIDSYLAHHLNQISIYLTIWVLSR
jgi:hypothetical protein